MNYEETQYALAKQLNTAHTLQTDYGEVPLDAAMQQAIDQALRPILERRLDPPGAAGVDAAKTKTMDILGVSCFLASLYGTDYIEALSAAEAVEAIAECLEDDSGEVRRTNGLCSALITIARALSLATESRHNAAKHHAAKLDKLYNEQVLPLPARTIARSEVAS